jgi:hypothetical protein
MFQLASCRLVPAGAARGPIQAPRRRSRRQSMIPKSAKRFSEKIMLKQRAKAG